MAITLTPAELAAALRLLGSDEEIAQVTRLLTYATERVEKHAPAAPDVVMNEACIRLAAYLFDQPYAPAGARYANALRNSGAGNILLPYRIHRAGSTGETEVEATSPTPGGGGFLRWK